MKIATMIVDDEAPGRAVLRDYIANHEELELVGEAEDGDTAVSMIERLNPKLLFLDVQMPTLDGFGVIEGIPPERMPTTIFVTAYDHYAVRAFEAHAVDYLLKPFDKLRFDRALRRAEEQIVKQERAAVEARMMALVSSANGNSSSSERFVVRTAGRITFLSLDEIDWIEAAANYVRIHAGKEVHQLRESIGSLSERLDPARFGRVHRSYIVNLKKVRELQACNSGEYIAVLKNGKQIPCSRGYRDNLKSLFT